MNKSKSYFFLISTIILLATAQLLMKTGMLTLSTEMLTLQNLLPVLLIVSGVVMITFSKNEEQT